MATLIRLERLISNLGYGSRKYVSAAIKAGAIENGGVVFADPSQRINPDEFRFATYDGQPLDPVSPLTVLFHKPRGYTCSTDEDGELIYDLLPRRWRFRDPVLSTAGRLDKDSTGLVLLTDDGQLLHKIISPKTHVEKHYKVTLRDPLKGNEAELFATGEFELGNDPKPLKPARWIPDGDKSGTMILQEGRYHQIRRMFETIGNHVEALHRFQLGALNIHDLPEGDHRILSGDDLPSIFGK